MQLQLMLFAVLAVAFAQEGRYSDNSGQYVHNPNEGRYVPDNSGAYYPDGSGNYRHDGQGGYADDGSGRYAGDKNSYTGSKFGSGSGSGRFGSGFGSGNLVGANTFQSPSVVRPVVPKPAAFPAAGFGSQTSATNTVGVRGGAGSYTSGRYNDEGKWKIIRQSGDVDLDGYHWDYLTENGINAEESGKLFNKGTDAEAMRAQGFYTYTGPDNVVYTVRYTADENGFVAQGDHLPTPPPIPEAILKALDYQRSIGKL